MTQTITQQQDKPVKHTHKTQLIALPIILITLGIISILISGTISENYGSFVGLLVITGFASCLCGGLLGFLFGIPKLNKNYNPHEDYKTTQKYDPNTNLEDISDWLTKIIVGVSLTQLTKIPSAFMSIADYILAGNHCKFDCDFAKPIIISIIIFFLITGFLIGYFYTRLLLPKLLTIADDNEYLENKVSMWKQSYEQVTDTGNSITKTTSENISQDINIQTKLKSLTEKETEIVKLILSKDNKFIIEKLFNIKEFSAINVLLEKKIIAITQGDTLRSGAILSVVDKDIIDNFPK